MTLRARVEATPAQLAEADGNRTRLCSVDSGVPYQSVSTAQMGVSESTHLLLHHPALRLGAPTNVEDTAERCLSGDQPGLHNDTVPNLVGPPGFEPRSHPSEGCALSS